MQTKNLFFDESCEREIIEKVSEVLPHIRIAVFAQTFVVKAINLGDLSTLVISTQDKDAFFVANFKRNQQ
jgi:hypothetical protein